MPLKSLVFRTRSPFGRPSKHNRNYTKKIIVVCHNRKNIHDNLAKESECNTFLIQCSLIVYIYIYMGVSTNNGTPKSSILIGFSIINHPFWDTPIFGNIHIYVYTHVVQSSPIFMGQSHTQVPKITFRFSTILS